MKFYYTNAGRERGEDEKELEIKFEEYRLLVNNFMQKANRGDKSWKPAGFELEAVYSSREEDWSFDIEWAMSLFGTVLRDDFAAMVYSILAIFKNI